jgi:Na+-transporting NADH:ubiquinone oxidoreductase subunit A
MEQLGIYEVAAEDLAMCSYICPSKVVFGDIIQKGIEPMEKEG